MTDVEQQLLSTLNSLAEEAPLDPDLLDHVLARAGHRGFVPRHVLVTAAVVVLIVAISATASIVKLAGTSTQHLIESQPDDPKPATCPSSLTPTLLPVWARVGFSEPETPMAQVLGDDGEIVAVIFGNPLTSPPSPDRNNKILWVPRAGPGDLTITATPVTGEPVVIEAQAGPSIIDLPAPGCWHLELSWGQHTDSLDLRYHPR